MSLHKIESFHKDAHDRSQFDCGKPALNQFLKSYVTQYERRGLCRAFVCISAPERRVIGYYTLSSSAINFNELPAEYGRNFPGTLCR